MEWVAIVFIFFGVIAITALLFGGWLVFTLIRLVLRAIGAVVSPAQLPPPVPQEASRANATHGVRCANAKCRHVSPATAQFCRRCGGALPAIQRVPTRRVAMW